MSNSSLGRRAFVNFLIPMAAFVLAPFNVSARETTIKALKRYSNVPDVKETPPIDEDQSSLMADLIMDALDHDPDLRAEIIEWLTSDYLAECRAVIIDENQQEASTA